MAYSRIKKLADYLRPYWQMVTGGIVALLIVNLLGVYIPILIRDIIDDLSKSFDFKKIFYYLILIVALASIMWFIRMISRVLLFGIGRQVEFDLKQKIFEHLLTLEPAYFSKQTSGDLINRATSDVDNVRRLLGFALLSLANTFFAYGLTLPVMLAIHIPLSIAAISVYPLMLIAVQLFSSRLQRKQKKVQAKISDLSDLIQEDMSGITLIKIYAQEANERLAFKQRNGELLKANLDLAQTRNFLFPLIEALAYVSLLALLALGTRQIISGNITIGDFIALLILAERLVFPTALLGFTITAYQQGEVSIDRLETILLAEAKIKDNADCIHLKNIQGKITAKALTFFYPDAKEPALKSLSFTINSGEKVAVVGAIGSGKSTLANAIPRLLDIAEGQLFIDDQDVTQIALEELRKVIAYVPQESFLFSTTIEDNIRYGDPLLNLTAVESAAKQARIQEEIENFPQKYGTLVGERGITLSGGQRQRASLARALAIQAPILILDDALSSVDNQTATAILENIAQESEKTVIFISHQLSAAATADRIFVMDRGEIVQLGTHEELIAVPGVYQNLWQQQQLESKVLQ